MDPASSSQAHDGQLDARLHPYHLVHVARVENSLPKLAHAVEVARTTLPDAKFQEFLNRALQMVVRNGCTNLTAYLLDNRHAQMSSLNLHHIAGKPSVELLELLLSHGWDVNQATPPSPVQQGRRLIDHVCHDEELVRWLVEHGATVDHGEFEDTLDARPPPLLQTCALVGSVSTFKLLQSKGARPGKKTLHIAVSQAVSDGADPAAAPPAVVEGPKESELDGRRRRAAEMLRFLVDDVGLDVNGMDTDTPMYRFHHGTPLNYAAQHKNGAAVVRWLLSKGADPTIPNLSGEVSHWNAEQFAKAYECDEVLRVLREWKESKGLASTS